MRAETTYDEIVMFGSRGHSQMILRGAEEFWRGRVALRAVVDDLENGFSHPILNVPVISSVERLTHFRDVPVVLGVGSPSLRAEIAARLDDEGATLATCVPPTATHLDPSVHFGAGSICAAFTRIGPGVRIGVGAQVMATLVAHDVEIGAFSNVAVHSSVLGHVMIGREVNIAPHAVIANGTRERPLQIGDGAIIGVGAVVVRDVPAGARMVGNPAMTVEKWKKLSQLLEDR